MNIQGTCTNVEVFRGSFLQVPAEATLITFPDWGRWWSPFDMVLRQTSAARNEEDARLGLYSDGWTTTFHQSLSRQWLARQEIAHCRPAQPGEIYISPGSLQQAPDYLFRDVVFVFDPVFISADQVYPTGQLLRTAFELLMRTTAYENVTLPIWRRDLLETQSLLSLLRDHAQGIALAACSVPSLSLNLTVVVEDEREHDLFEKALASLAR